MSISWIYLIIAGLFEVLFTVALKHSVGFSKLIPSAITIVLILASYFFVSLAMKTIPIGTAYAVWAGIGAVGAVLCGIFFFGDSYDIIRLISVSLIIIGIFGLKFSHVE